MNFANKSCYKTILNHMQCKQYGGSEIRREIIIETIRFFFLGLSKLYNNKKMRYLSISLRDISTRDQMTCMKASIDHPF